MAALAPTSSRKQSFLCAALRGGVLFPQTGNEMKFQVQAIACAMILLSQGALAAESKPLKPDVVAVQDGVEVTLKDVDAEAENIPEKDRAGFFDSPKRIESTVMGILQKKEMAAQARAQHLDRDPAVKAQIEAAITATLAKAQIDHYRESLKLPDFDALAKEYYLGHKDEFIEKGKVEVQHVLVATKDPARNDADAKALIGKIAAEAKAHPDHFDDLVAKYSDDPSKSKNNGHINNATSPKLAPTFADAAERLHTPDEISSIVKTEFGYHVLKLIKRIPDKQLEFEQVHSRIVARLKSTYIEQQMTQYTNEFRGRPLQANPDVVASLRTRYAPKDYVSPEDAADDAATKTQQDQQAKPADQH
ncbi:MAG TPA: peptidylprolyl isomerase [Rudaea sp.]|jgi:peptidyl-prolyl cis-trans isomerase C|nr:peptidylprolyl isomerase [Rudaea sp.]